MAEPWSAVLLGTGTSVGVPMIGCDCAVCRSPDPRNQRLRSALLLQSGERRIVVDCGPDFRLQALRAGIATLDALILTHEHADHLFGLDELRLYSLRSRRPVPIWGFAETLEVVRRVFAYAFHDEPSQAFRPKFDLRAAPPDEPFEVAGLSFLPIPVEHAGLTVLGLRLGDFAYIPDVKQIPAASMDRLRGLDTLIVDGLRPKPHHTHFHTDEALAAIAELRPRQAYLTHLTHDVDASTFEATLPEGVRLAFDGLRVPVRGVPAPAS